MFLGFHLLASENLFDDAFFIDDESGADGALFFAQHDNCGKRKPI